MRSSMVSATFIALIATFSALFVPHPTLEKKAITGGIDEPPFIVAVVANGVPPKGPVPPRPEENSPEAKGFDLWIGATAAMKQLKEAGSPPDFSLVGFDDDDTEDKARDVARQLETNPRVLAVVGHGITSTTRAAGTAYDDFRIPLVIPFATAETATLREKPDKRSKPQSFHNAYRLLPSDETVQAPALAYTVRKLAPTGTQVYLEVGFDGNAEQYALPLCEKVRELLQDHSPKPHLKQITNLSDDISYIQDDQKKHPKAGVIVFCGYQREASNFLRQLDSHYCADQSLTPPTVIFNDGVFGIEETAATLKTKFPIYRTTGQRDPDLCEDKTILKDAVKALSDNELPGQRKVTTPQTLGFDAIRLLAKAATNCKGRLSRECILGQLSSGQTFMGICTDYSFHDGQNAVSNYYVAGPPDSPPSGLLGTTNGTQTITPQELRHFLVSQSGQANLGVQ